jgi:hydrogenase/urease accessory protein HupE
MTTKTITRLVLKATSAAAFIAAAGPAARAHTGHGHEEFSAFAGLLHALREPDHLAMLALGIAVTGALAPLVPKVGRGAVRLLRRTLAARRAAATTALEAPRR